MKNPESLEEQLLDSVLNNPSASGQLDHLRASYPSDDLLEVGLRGGFIEASGLGKMSKKSGSSEFNPGIHRGIDIKSVNTADGNEQIIARNPRIGTVPLKSHVVIDMPARTDTLLGNYAYRNVANFVLALTRHVSEVKGSTIAVYSNNGSDAGLIFEDRAEFAYIAELNLEDKTGFIEESDTSISGLAELVRERSNVSNDAVFIVSDLQDGYDLKNGVFEWEKPLSDLASDMSDRLWLTKIGSPSLKALDYGLLDGLDIDTIDAMNREYASVAADKEQRVNDFFENNPSIRRQDVELVRRDNADHPVNLMTIHILGQKID